MVQALLCLYEQFCFISATTLRHFDKLVTNTKYIGDKYETHWWQIQRTSVANTKYGVRKNKESAKLSDLAIKGKTSAALQFPATLGTMPLWKTTPGTMPQKNNAL